MRRAIQVEWWKLRRSRVTATATVLMGLLLPGLGFAFYSVAISGGNGALAGKARALLTGEGWEGYLGLVGQIAAVAFFLGAGIVVSWVFGREHVDRTFPSLLARPTSPGTMAAAKFIVAATWALALSGVIALVTLALGILGGVGPVDADVVAGSVGVFAICTGAGLLALTLGYVASIGRGYLPAIGALIVIVAVSQIAVLFGTGAWFPYAVPGLLAVAGTEGIPEPGGAQVFLVPALAAATAWLTVRWWSEAEVV